MLEFKLLKFLRRRRIDNTIPPGGDEDEDDFNMEHRSWFGEYSDQYAEIVSEGHSKPPPSLGSPTFIWHITIWQRRTTDEVKNAQSDQILEDYKWHDIHEKNFIKEVSDFLLKLQRKGRVIDADVEPLDYSAPLYLPSTSTRKTHRFGIFEPHSLSFTLWWQDEASAINLNKRQVVPDPKDLRVRVQSQTHQDHVTITFFIDAAKPYDRKQLYSTDEPSGEEERKPYGKRRKLIFDHLKIIRATSDNQLKSGAIERDSIPELDVSDSEASKLLEASNYIYEGVWQDFKESFDIDFSESNSINVVEGECFADLRGFMMFVPGISTDISDKHEKTYDKLRKRLEISNPRPTTREGHTANIGIGSFGVFDNENGEPNTVIKALWPFVRRTAPWADYRDFVACGIIGWRALYIMAQPSSDRYYASEEWKSRSSEVPKGYLPKEEKSGKKLNSQVPLRYLVLTKEEPHRQQIGRFIERVNAVNTMRLFSLKNLSTIKNATTHIRIIDRQLDGVLYNWTKERRKIEKEIGFKRSLIRKLGGRSLGNFVEQQNQNGPKISTFQEEKVNDERIKKLSELISKTETKLIQIGADLENIGERGSGRLLYLISRAKYYINEFERMSETLEIGNIDGWINYNQFVQRGLQPTFNMIRGTGDRLSYVRSRLQEMTELIQTSALIIEMEATRVNTQTLKNILSSIFWLKLSLFSIAIILFFLLLTVTILMTKDKFLSIIQTIFGL